MGVARGALGPWSPKDIVSMICLPFCQFYKEVILCLSEHGDIIKAQKIILCLCDLHNNMHITQSLSPKIFYQNSVPGHEPTP